MPRSPSFCGRHGDGPRGSRGHRAHVTKVREALSPWSATRRYLNFVDVPAPAAHSFDEGVFARLRGGEGPLRPRRAVPGQPRGADSVLAVKGGMDLGGTKVQAVVVAARGKVVGEAKLPTPQEGGPVAVVDAMPRPCARLPTAPAWTPRISPEWAWARPARWTPRWAWCPRRETCRTGRRPSRWRSRSRSGGLPGGARQRRSGGGGRRVRAGGGTARAARCSGCGGAPGSAAARPRRQALGRAAAPPGRSVTWW